MSSTSKPWASIMRWVSAQLWVLTFDLVQELSDG